MTVYLSQSKHVANNWSKYYSDFSVKLFDLSVTHLIIELKMRHEIQSSASIQPLTEHSGRSVEHRRTSVFGRPTTLYRIPQRKKYTRKK